MCHCLFTFKEYVSYSRSYYRTNGLFKRGRLYPKWDINGHLTSQPALNKQRGRGNENCDLHLRHFSTGITGLSGPDPDPVP